MSIKLMTMVFDRYPNGGGEMILALALADHAKDDGTKIYPSIKSLAEKTRQSERTVQYQLRRMEESGWLILVNNGNGGRNQTREYRINPEWIKGADIAPVQSATEKGAADDAKGANDDKKGCNGLHPHIPTIEPSLPINKPSSARAKIALPDWLPLESWDMWARYRRTAGKWSEDAKRLNLAKLKRLYAEGHDPTLVIEQSIERGWTGLFPLKSDTQQAGRKAPAPENFKEKAYVGTDEADIDWL